MRKLVNLNFLLFVFEAEVTKVLKINPKVTNFIPIWYTIAQNRFNTLCTGFFDGYFIPVMFIK